MGLDRLRAPRFCLVGLIAVSFVAIGVAAQPDAAKQPGMYYLGGQTPVAITEIQNRSRRIVLHSFFKLGKMPEAAMIFLGGEAPLKIENEMPSFELRLCPTCLPEKGKGQAAIMLLHLQQQGDRRELPVRDGRAPMEPLQPAIPLKVSSPVPGVYRMKPATALPPGEYLITFGNEFGRPSYKSKISGYDFEISKAPKP